MDEAGVYTITCLPTGKVYVGSTVRRFCQRFGNHRSNLRKGVHHSIHLQRSWNKHGEAAFEFRPLLVCCPEDAVFYEQRAIDVLKPVLNMSPTAGNTFGIKHSEEHRQKCRERMQREWDAGKRTASLKVWHSNAEAGCLSAMRKRDWAEGKYAARISGRKHPARYLVFGEMLTVSELVKKYDLPTTTIRSRLRLGAVGNTLVRLPKPGQRL